MANMVSIIVPVYNVEQYISRCIDSILAQTYTNWELILIDDGSTDRSGEICDQYASNTEKIRVIHQANRGVSVARNAGIETAAGDYLLFADADDWLDKMMLEGMIAEGNNADLIVCEYYFAYSYDDGRNETVPMHVWKNHNTPFETKDIAYEIMTKTGVLWNKLIKRDVIENARFMPGVRYGEDMLFLGCILKCVDTAMLIPRPYYIYYQNRQGNVVSAGIDERSLEFLRSSLLLYNELRALGEGVCGVARVNITVDIVLSKIPYAQRRIYHEYFSRCKDVLNKTTFSDRLGYMFDKRFGLTAKGKIGFMIKQLSPELFFKIKSR